MVRHWLDADGGAVFPRLIVDAGADSSLRCWSCTPCRRGRVREPGDRDQGGRRGPSRLLGCADLGPKVWHIGSQVSHIGAQAHLRASSAALGGSTPGRVWIPIFPVGGHRRSDLAVLR